MNDFSKDLEDYICSGHPLLNVDTFEKDRAIATIGRVASELPDKRGICIWSVSEGWIDSNGVVVTGYK